MDILNLINRLKNNNIDLSLSGNDLEINYDGEELPAAVLSEIKYNKTGIVDFLKKMTPGKEIDIPRASQQFSYPVSSSQRRLWILSQFEESSRAYNMPGVYVFEGQLDQNALEDSVKVLMTRHEMLRTVFGEDENGEIRQYIYSPEEMTPVLFCRDVRGMDQQDERLKKEIQAEIYKSFDLAAGPLLRTRLYQIADDKWIFLYVVHHIISDGWSMNVLVNELLLLYNAHTRGIVNPLSPLKIQYKDYAIWQQQQLSSTSLVNHRSYWLKQFEGELPVLELPADNPRPLVKAYNGEMISRQFRPEISDGIRSLCQEQGATLFMGLLSAIDVLLYRYTGHEDIIIGSPIAGRDHTDLESQIGCYVNTLALRSRFKGKDSYRDLLSRVRQMTLDAYEHQVYPFDELVDELHLQRDKSRSPLFDIMVVLQNVRPGNTGGAQQLGGLKVNTYQEAKERVSKFDLTFNFVEMADGIWLEIEYNNDIYKDNTIRRLFDHLERLMTAFIQFPSMAIEELDYLSGEEKGQLLDAFNDTAADFPENRTLISLFEDQVNSTPDRIALVTGGEEISYKELNTWANQLGHYLRQHYQMGPDDLAAVRLDRNKWLIIALLGVLKSGGAYVPVDTDYPQERVDYILSDSNCKVLIDEQELDKFIKIAAGFDRNNCRPVSGPTDLAYVIYTSGSTGKPKGCALEQRGVINRLDWMWKEYGFSSEDIILQKTAFTFDVSVWEIFMPLCWGAKMVLCRKDDARSAERILSLITEQQITCLHFVPSMLNEFMTALFDRENIAGRLKSLRNVVASGEALQLEAVRRWYDKVDIPLHNLYGPTEASVDVTACTTSWEDNKILIGRPISNTQITILGTAGQLVPIGVVGEICIGGVCLARGYLNRPELTAQKFVDDPYRKGQRIYRTGDWGKWWPNGAIQYLGRMDDQVKVRGYRIEPREIESLLQRYEKIDAAMVMVRTDKKGDNNLVAYLVSKEPLDISGIRSHLGKLLPAYMLPDYYVGLEAFPLNASGKIDRKQLPDPENLSMASGVTYVPPGNATEKELASIWKDILGREQIGIKDDFFHLGGHSLKVGRLASHIYKTFQVKPGLKDLFDNTTLEEQALLIQQAQKTSFNEITPADIMPYYPLSSSQMRLWLLSQLESGNIAYNIPGIFLFEGDVNLDRLNQSFQMLLERHESLRTLFKKNQQGEVKQFIVPVEAVLFKVDYKDLRSEPDPAQTANILVRNECMQPFNLTEAPLLRASVFQVADKKWVFNLVIHHIISDGWSMTILFRELLAFYKTERQGGDTLFSPLRVQYKDYAVWQQKQLSGPQFDNDKNYWLQQFAGELPVLDLPLDKIRPIQKTYNGGAVNRKLNSRLTAGLKTLTRQHDATLFMGLLAVVKTLIYRYTQQKDIIVGSPIAGRQHVDLEDQIGIYLNTLVLRTRFEDTDSYGKLLENIREITTEAYAHQAYPLDALVDELQLQVDSNRNALFDVMVELFDVMAELQNDNKGEKEEADPGALKVFEYKTGNIELCKFDLHFKFREHENEIDFTLIYNSDIYAPETIGRMINHLELLLSAILENPATPLCDLDYLSPGEKRQLLFEFNDTRTDYPQDRTVVDLFRQQVLRTPDAIAVEFETVNLSYDELDKAANRIANYLLIDRHVQPGDRVAVMLDRSAEMIIAIMAILKSGAAYVPIDPENPPSRTDYILKESGANTLLTNASFAALFTHYHGSCFLMDAGADMPDSYTAFPDVTIRPTDLAYVIYTSGSTGHPKGVMIRHESLIDYFFGITARTNIRDCIHFGLVSTIAADLGNTVIYTSLLTGGTLHIFSRADLLDPDKLFAKKLDCLKIVPSHWKSLQQVNKTFLPDKCLIFGGEQLTPDVLEKIKDGNTQCKVYNHYGPTEATIGKIAGQVDLKMATLPIPLGMPFGKDAIYILDDRNKLTPLGVTGEICITGAGLALGYINQPELTAQKFIPNPFKEHERMYKTGDLGKWMTDGAIVFLGRKDDQVKIHGYRIELSEIEIALRSHPDIDSSFVQARPGKDGEKELIGYLVSRKTVSPEDLRSFLANTLPAYMLPAHFVFLEQLPLTPNGKVDRKQLPDPGSADAHEKKGYVPPKNDMEQKLVGIWEDMLGREKIGIKDDFFTLGGNSLKVIGILKKVMDATGITVPLKVFFQGRTIENIAGWLMDAMSATNENQSYYMAPAKEQQQLIEISYNQLTFLSEHGQENPLVITPYELVDLDSKALESAINQLIDRHEVLRARFVRSGEKIMQNISAPGSSPFKMPELVQISADEELDSLIERVHARKIDPFNDPLMLLDVCRMPDGHYLVLLTMHHAITDGYSDGILRSELMLFYNAILYKEPVSLKPLQFQYRDFVEWQKKFVHSSEGRRHKEYWNKKLEGLPLSALAAPDRMAGDNGRHIGKSFCIARVLEGDAYEKADHFAKNAGLTRAALLMGGLISLLDLLIGKDEVSLSVTVSGRNSRHYGSLDLSGLIGYFANSIIVRTRVNKDLPAGDYFLEIQNDFLEALSYDAYPFEKLIREMPGVTAADFFDAQCYFNYHNYTHLNEHTYIGKEEERRGVLEYRSPSKMPMGLSVKEYKNCLKLEIVFDSSRFTAEQSITLSDYYFSLLMQVIADPQLSLRQLTESKEYAS